MKTLKFSMIRKNPFNLNILSSQSIFLRNLVHEMHAGKLRIVAIIPVAWNLCRKWQIKPTKNIYLLHLTAHSTASTQLFRTHIYKIGLFRSHLPVFIFLTYSSEYLCINLHTVFQETCLTKFLHFRKILQKIYLTT